ncbi:MAG: CSLREA domain-containing protein [Holophagales bacterium]|nr:MAG: CSLREA domain-containing protein [Holophagales bacterium]
MRTFGWLTAFGLAVASSVSGSTIQVTTLVDENNGCASGAGCSLREALASAGNGDTVAIGLGGTMTLTLGELAPASDVVIQGPGAATLTLSGNVVGRVVSVAAGRSVELRALTLRSGRAPAVGDPHGGCVKNAGVLTLADVVLEDCQARSMPADVLAAGGDGGAIYNASGATLVVQRSAVRLSRAGAGGGNPTSPPAGGRGGGLFNAGSATVSDSTIESNLGGGGGSPTGAGGDGGGVHSLGSLLVERSTVSGNASGDGAQFCIPSCSNGRDGKGGGIWASGAATLNNVTVSGNTIGSTAAGLSNTGGGLLLAPGSGVVDRLRNVTVSANTASGAGGGLAREGAGTIRLRATILGGNAAGTNDKDCTGGSAALVSEGWNLVRVNSGCTSVFGALDQVGTLATPLDPGLGALAANGGPTATHALLSTSPALDAGSVAGCVAWDPQAGSDVALTVDQRGEGRPRDGDGDLEPICDLGAYEAPDLPVVTYLLQVSPLGLGTGSVQSAPAGIDCPGDCQQVYLEGSGVTLDAVADPGSFFGGWSGDCLGSAGCVVQMSADRTVGATFGRLFAVTVSKSGAGSGSVASAPPGIACGADCSELYAEGTAVELSAAAEPPSVFVGWSGDCDGRLACSLVVDGARSATARFEPSAVAADGFESGDLSGWSASAGD